MQNQAEKSENVQEKVDFITQAIRSIISKRIWWYMERGEISIDGIR